VCGLYVGFSLCLGRALGYLSAWHCRPLKHPPPPHPPTHFKPTTSAARTVRSMNPQAHYTPDTRPADMMDPQGTAAQKPNKLRHVADSVRAYVMVPYHGLVDFIDAVRQLGHVEPGYCDRNPLYLWTTGCANKLPDLAVTTITISPSSPAVSFLRAQSRSFTSSTTAPTPPMRSPPGMIGW
jgi:hypothetical protein